MLPTRDNTCKDDATYPVSKEEAESDENHVFRVCPVGNHPVHAHCWAWICLPTCTESSREPCKSDVARKSNLGLYHA